MDRRDFLKTACLAGAGIILGNKLFQPRIENTTMFSNVASKLASEEEPVFGGWIKSIENRKRFIKTNPKPFMNQLDAEIR
ncbi:MAG: twin-arginine translocation signal domain-containing protein, partial [Bacteroidales bacterium]